MASPDHQSRAAYCLAADRLPDDKAEERSKNYHQGSKKISNPTPAGFAPPLAAFAERPREAAHTAHWCCSLPQRPT